MNRLDLQFRHLDFGGWCAYLVPVCVWISRIKGNLTSDPLELQVLSLSVSITLSSFTWANQELHKTPEEKKAQINWIVGQLALPALIMTLCLNSDLHFGNLVTILGHVLYGNCLPLMFSTFKRSFTFGEGCIVLQSIVLFVAHAITSLYYLNDDTTTIVGSFTVIAKAALLSLAFIFVVPAIPGFRWTNYPAFFYASGLTVFASITLPLLCWMLRRNPLLWLTSYIVFSTRALMLMFTWIYLVISALAIVVRKFNTSAKATTSERKFFHGLVSVVITSGIALDVEFTYLASLLVLGIFLLLEYIRVCSIKPISTVLDEAFVRFIDEKDQGTLILTNIYLLVGTFLPLWLACDLASTNKLILLSGVLSVGIGDSAASIIGSRYGRRKLLHTTKTLEGTAASILSQIIVLQFLSLANLIQYNSILGLFVPIICVSVLEAYTTQVDNVVLPLILYIMYNAVL